MLLLYLQQNQRIMLKQKNRQIQSFLIKHNSYGKLHQICCKNQCSDVGFYQPSTKIKQSSQKITLKKYKSSVDRSKFYFQSRPCQSMPSKNDVSPYLYQSQPLSNNLPQQNFSSGQVSPIKKIFFSYPVTQVKSHQILPTTQSLAMIKSQNISIKLEYSQISNQSLENQLKTYDRLKIPVSEAKSTEKIDYTISMQNQSQEQASRNFSRPVSPSVDIQFQENTFGDSKNQSKWIGDAKSQQELIKIKPIQQELAFFNGQKSSARQNQSNNMNKAATEKDNKTVVNFHQENSSKYIRQQSSNYSIKSQYGSQLRTAL